MSEFDNLCCPFRAEAVAAVPARLALVINVLGSLALLFMS
jgi:hypothetical protein